MVSPELGRAVHVWKRDDVCVCEHEVSGYVRVNVVCEHIYVRKDINVTCVCERVHKCECEHV